MRKTHRYLGVFIGIQILFWCASGIYFAWYDIDEIRGSHLRRAPEIDLNFIPGSVIDIAVALQSVRESVPGVQSINAIRLRKLLDEPVYEISYSRQGQEYYQLVNARNGNLLDGVNEKMAIEIALADFAADAEVLEVILLEHADAHAEYRGRDLPVYRVSMDHESKTNIYVSRQRGVVSARRNQSWRVFDFLWMLHTMDFDSRDNFNNVLLKIFSVLALLTVIGGFVLWFLSSRFYNKQST